jgi:hypothetical protein
MNKVAGVFLDGSELKVAILEKRKDRIAVEDLLILRSLNEENADKTFTGTVKDTLIDDAMELIIDADDKETINEEYNPFKSLQEFKDLNSYHFIPCVSEPHVSYQIVNELNGAPSKEIQKELFKRWQNSPKSVHALENVNFIRYKDNTILSIYSNEYFPVLVQLEKLTHAQNTKRLKIPCVKSADAAITSYILDNFEIQTDKVYLTVHLGHESTRMMFFKDEKFIHISEYLSFGSQTHDIAGVLASKIAYEMDNAQLYDIYQIFLCGEIAHHKIIEAIKNTLPFANIKIVEFDDLVTKDLSDEKKYAISAFAFPIATGLNYIKKSKRKSKKHDLSPKRIKDSQAVFQLGVLGYSILILLLLSMIFLAQNFYYNHKDIARSDKILMTKNKEAEELKFFEQRILDLQSKMDQKENLRVIVDTLKVGSGRWIDLLNRLDEYDLKKNNMWVTSILLSDQGINLTGVSVGRKSIPNFSQYLFNSNIKNILNHKIRDKKINVFEIIADPEKFGYQVSSK